MSAKVFLQQWKVLFWDMGCSKNIVGLCPINYFIYIGPIMYMEWFDNRWLAFWMLSCGLLLKYYLLLVQYYSKYGALVYDRIFDKYFSFVVVVYYAFC